MKGTIDQTLIRLNRLILALTAIYAFMAVLSLFSTDPAVDHAEAVLLCYGAIAFFLWLSRAPLHRRIAQLCTIMAYGLLGFSIGLGFFGLSLAGLFAGAAVIAANAHQRYQNLDSTLLTGVMLSYWIVMYGFSATLMDDVPLIGKSWDVLFYPFYPEGIQHIAFSWRGLFILLGGWLFERYVNRTRIKKHQAKADTAKGEAKEPAQVYAPPVRVASPPFRADVHSSAVAASALVQDEPEDEFEKEEIYEQEYEESEAEEDPQDRQEALRQALAVLENMVGLAPLKAEIQSFLKQMQGHLITQRLGKVVSTKPTLHMVFAGPPGTGKTEVARIMRDLLYGLELTEARVLVEADRSSIVGAHIGATEEKMIGLLEDAWGGVLFIDEAYALARSESPNDFGREAIDVLIKAMEDYREHLVVIMAGYPSDMERFLEMNPGFRSRVPYTFSFVDYTPLELSEMARRMLVAKGYNCSRVATDLGDVVKACHRSGTLHGNGRWIRNFVERVIKEHNVRVSENANSAFIGHILPDDLRLAAGQHVPHDQAETATEGKRQLCVEAMAELHALVGLSTLKADIQRILCHVEVEQKRMQQGLTTEPINLHMLFEGPPGTGKTTVARIIGKFLNGLGVLANGHVIEADRSTIVGKWIGHTEANVKELLSRAKGGILFIDEAYALARSESPNDFGREAIDAIVKAMEDQRGKLVVILAGYSEEMKTLLAMNPGLSSRLPFRFGFAEYNASEILEIVQRTFHAKQFVLTVDAAIALEKQIQAYAARKGGVFQGNGRWVRNLADQVRMAQNNRLAQTGGSELMTLEAEDIRAAFSHMA